MKFDINDYEPKDILKIIREWTELSQKEFAKSIGSTETRIANYERGISGYKVSLLKKAAKTHNIKITIEKGRETTRI